jgi:hypothetical protein
VVSGTEAEENKEEEDDRAGHGNLDIYVLELDEWQQHFFEISGHNLRYDLKQQLAETAGPVDLRLVTFQEPDSQGCFVLQLPGGKDVKLCAKSEVHAQQWLMALQSSTRAEIGEAKKKNSPATAKSAVKTELEKLKVKCILHCCQLYLQRPRGRSIWVSGTHASQTGRIRSARKAPRNR